MIDPETGQDVDSNQVGDGALSAEQEIYKENIIDHYKHPHNKRMISYPTHFQRGINPSCGDQLDVYARMDKGIIVELSYVGNGCAISQASMSMLTERLKGKTPGEVVALGRDYVVEMLGIPIGPVRMKCAMLGLRTTQSAIGESSSSSAKTSENKEEDT